MKQRVPCIRIFIHTKVRQKLMYLFYQAQAEPLNFDTVAAFLIYLLWWNSLTLLTTVDIILISNQARSHTLEYHETGQLWLPWPCCDASHVQLPSVRGQSRFLWNVNSEELMTMRTVVIVLMSSVMTVTSDLVLVTSSDDNSIPVFEVYNPSMDQVNVVLLLNFIQIYLLCRWKVFLKFLVRGDLA